MTIPASIRLVVALIVLGSATAGCYHRHGHGHAHRDPVVDACVFGACVGSTYLGPRGHPAVAVAAGATAAALYLAANEGHLHGHTCGCRWRWYRGYRAYYWGGHWEYYEGGSWYIVEERGPGW